MRVTVHPPLKSIEGDARLFARQDGVEEAWRIVDPVEADPTLGFVSIAAPVGQVLLGGRIGNTVVATTPAGPRSLAILQVEEAVAPDEPGW